ncbi:MAG: hypothetical protein H6606_05995 [Flavobacteriales bacterium]|nr:hypothetical protein [Flavobacteriales bacterium]
MQPRKEIYRKISEALGELLLHKQVRYIGLQMGQLDAPDQSEPIPMPCILIGIQTIFYEMMTHNRAQGQATITLDVAFENYHRQFSGSIDTDQSEELMDLLDQILALMSYVRGDSFTDLCLQSEQSVSYNYSGIQLHRITFTCRTYHLIKPTTYVSITGGA